MVETIINNFEIWVTAQSIKSNGLGRNSNNQSLFGISKLRELILESAVQGKLVPQNQSELPASELHKKIIKAREGLVKQGKIKKQESLPEITEEEKPFSLPGIWKWVRLGEVTNYGILEKVEPDNVTEDTWVLDLEDVEKETSKLLQKVRASEKQFQSSKNRFHKGDVIYGKLRPYLDKVIIADEGGVCTTEMIPLKGYDLITPEYLRIVMKSPYFIKYANESTHGMNLPRLGTDRARLALFPLNSPSEQQRIVAKVDELMALCDQLEQEQSNSNAAHEILVETLLDTLTNAAGQAELDSAWERIASHFDILFTTEHSVDRLKQTILQLAVMGKLVPQNPEDEPAGELLKRIGKEKARLVKEGKIKDQETLAIIEKTEIPFGIPEKWLWTKLGNLSSDVHYGYNASANTNIEDVRLLRITDIQNDSVDWESVPGCAIEKRIIENYQLEDGDILIARTGGTIGKSYLVENINLCAVFASYLIRVKRIDKMYPQFIKIFLGSQLYWNQLYRNSMGTGQPNVNGTALKNLIIPLPPISEQHHIVAKVDELFGICDALKERIREAQGIERDLAEAVVEGTVR